MPTAHRRQLAAIAALLAAASLTSGCVIISSDDGMHVARDRPASPADDAQASRALPWSGGRALTVSVPGQVSFTPGPAAEIVASGPADMIAALRITGGEISLDRSCQGGCQRQGDGRPSLKITVVAPGVDRFETTGAARLDIQRYEGTRLDLTLSGASRITAAGRAGALGLDQSGAAQSDLTWLTLESATVSLSGASRAKLSPTRSARITASGAAQADLTVRPAELNESVSGAARVNAPGRPVG